MADDSKPRGSAGEGCCTDGGDSGGTTVVRDGLVLKSKRGDLYFIRSDVLEAAKITEAEMAAFLNEEAGKHYKQNRDRFTVDLGPITKIVPLTGPFDGPGEGVRSLMDMKARSTVMCPGSCRRVAYVVTDVDEF